MHTTSAPRNWPLRFLLLAFAALFLGYVFVGPLVTSRDASFQMRFFEAVIAVWFFFFGASLGSFLNVVVYRTPRGFSLLGSSFCPKCKHAIRWHDNIPVFGWISLRGRCRDCHSTIAGRYPLIEAITGLMVLGLAVVELFCRGANLPSRTSGGYPGLSWLAQQVPWDLVATLVAHTGLLCILLSWALIRRDGHRVPRGVLLFGLIFGLGLPALAPAVQPVAWIAERPQWLAECAWSQRFDTTVVGGLIGFTLGGVQALVSRVWRSRREPVPCGLLDLAAAVALVGAVLGWQAAVSTTLLAASIRVIASTVTGGVLSRNASDAWIFLVPATFLQILAWSALEGLASWPGAQTTPVGAIAPVALAMYFAVVASYVESRRTLE
ncbi:MAG: A24 family peptidase [Pirellulaceae bacterium]|nr:A24 family peptidase [Pirellulaceae bacterium]